MPRSTCALLALAIALLITTGLTAQAPVPAAPAGPASDVTFNKDIAPLVWEHCTVCHRAGEYAPFSLLTYADVRPRAREIARAVTSKHMPPWKPEPGYGEFIGDRSLTSAQIDLIKRWVDQGAYEGNPKDLPPEPTWAEGWYMGEPDLIITMPEPFAVPISDVDVFRTFVVPIPVTSKKYVKALEFHPGNSKVVHHANIKIDETRLSRELDEAEPGPGTGGGGSRKAVFPDGYFLGWTPGQRPRIDPGGMSWHVNPGSDMVIEMHMRPLVDSQMRPLEDLDSRQTVQASVGLFFTDAPPKQSAYMLRIGKQDIDIAPGQTNYVNEDSFTLPVDVDILGVQPHAHYLGTEFSGWATLPDGTRKWLSYIKKWDAHWQDVYQFKNPVALPKGTVLTTRITYDNSESHQNLPGQKPVRVIFGQLYGQEMGTLWIQVLPHSDADLAILDKAMGHQVLLEDIAGDLKMLEAEPNNARLHADLGDCYADAGRVADAVKELTIAEQLDPSAFRGYDLGRLLIAARQFPEAAAAFSRAIARQPEFPESLYGLGLSLDVQGKFAEAADAYQRALQLNGDLPDAHFNLARILHAQGRFSEAITHYEHALRLRPDDAEAAAVLKQLKSAPPPPSGSAKR